MLSKSTSDSLQVTVSHYVLLSQSAYLLSSYSMITLSHERKDTVKQGSLGVEEKQKNNSQGNNT